MKIIVILLVIFLSTTLSAVGQCSATVSGPTGCQIDNTAHGYFVSGASGCTLTSVQGTSAEREWTYGSSSIKWLAAGNYDLAFTCSCGTVTGTIHIDSGPSISSTSVTPSSQSVCPGATASAMTVSGTPTGTISWEKRTTGGSWSTISGATTTSLSNSYIPTDVTRDYRMAVTLCGQTVYSNTATVTVLSAFDAPSVTGKYRFTSGTFSLLATNQTYPLPVKYNWYAPGGMQQKDVTVPFVTSSISSTTPTYLTVKALGSNGCESVGTIVDLTILAQPVIGFPGTSYIPIGGSTTLGLSQTYDSYSWSKAILGVIGTASTLSVSEPGTYTVTVTKETSSTSTSFVVGDNLHGVNVNYVSENSIQKSGVTTPEEIPLLLIGQRQQKTQYFDGLGRGTMSVVTQGSPVKSDLVQAQTYNKVGKDSITYLPFVADDNGRFKSAVTSTLSSFYSGSSGVTYDAAPYTVSVYESSSLGRVLKQGAPGTVWQPNSTNTYASTDHTIKKDYGYNATSEVLLWTMTTSGSSAMGLVSAGTASSPVYYTANSLRKTKTKDEHQNEVIEYQNMSGQVVLKRVQAVSGSVTVNDTNYASTYYVYDDYGNLFCVIPPEATKRVPAEYFQSGATDVTKESFLSRWAFRYNYDGLKRMTHKQVPGADPVYMVYDNRDRLVLTQDGIERSAMKWLFTKYDSLNRPVSTGVYTHDSIKSQAWMSAKINGSAKLCELYNGVASTHGYTNTVWPISGLRMLTVTYYDGYDFKSMVSGFNYVNNDLTGQPSIEFLRVKGMATGSKVNTLGTNEYLYGVTYYDDHSRVIQTIAQNHVSGTDRLTNRYDFSGKLLKSLSVHTDGSIVWKDVIGGYTTPRSIKKTASTAWGNSGGASVEMLPANTDGWVEVTVRELNGYKMFGLSSTNADADYNSIQFALIPYYAGSLAVYESGVAKTGDLGAALGDVLRIERVGTAIKYYKNGLLQYTSATTSSSALLLDVAMYSTGDIFDKIRTSWIRKTNTVYRSFRYDHAGRLTKTWHKVNSGDSVLIVQNEYNELGQLVDKKLHSIDNGGTFKQSIDYRYNIRGWLTSINNSQLTNDGTLNNDIGDLFGMQLGYDGSIGTGNAGMYNGNISGMKWSRNQALGSVKDVAYNYGYDPMNRIKTATYKKDTVGGWLNSKKQFSEGGYDYDLNGNILKLGRRGSSGATIDSLSYDYGSGSSYSNKLLKVTDAGIDTVGFKDGNKSSNDYAYDANGNMTVDKNKDITAIYYNHLNLPSYIVKGTGDYMLYTYDASGRKLNQEVYNSGNVLQKSTDYSGEYYYENDSLKFINHEEGRIVMNGAPEYQYHLKDHLGNVRTTFTTVASTSVERATHEPGTATHENGEFIRYDKAKRINSVLFDHTHLTNGTGAASIYSNNFGSNYTSISADGTITLSLVSGRLKAAGASAWNAVYLNPTTIEGHRYKVSFDLDVASGSPVYAFSHDGTQGFNTGSLTISSNGTYNYEFTALSSTTLIAFTNGGSGPRDFYLDNFNVQDLAPGGTGSYSERLNGTANEKYGLARSISVMPGDTVKAEVYAKFLYGDPAGWGPALTALMSQIGSGASGVVIDGAGYATSTSSFPHPGMLTTSDITGGPKGYLNWLIFDRDYHLITGGFDQISPEAVEYGQGVKQDYLVSPSIVITQPGYVYVYLSNEEPSDHPVDVYFDDFKVTQVKSPVVQQDDYYPFGLRYNSYSREDNLINKKVLFQGQEHVDDLGLDWDSFKWRNHQPDIGRFFNVDPLSEKYYYNSPYAFSENKVVAHIELEGLESLGIEAINVVEQMAPQPDYSGYHHLMNGVKNVLMGVAGAAGTGYTIGQTAGVAAPLGAGAAFALSLGTIAMGFTQIVDGAVEMYSGAPTSNSQATNGSDNLPGLIATGSKHHDVINAAGAVLPNAMSPGGVVGPIKEGVQAIAGGGGAVETVVKVINAGDAVQSVVSAGTEVEKEIKQKDQGATSGNPPVTKQ